jgi:hypothetical protein
MLKTKLHRIFFLAALSTAPFIACAHAATEKVLYSFDSATGDYPNALIFDQAGNLYGTAFYGGNTACNGEGCGVVFKLTPNANGEWTESTIYKFSGGTDGSHPYSPPILDQAGNLYGTTYGAFGDGGGTGSGTAYRLSPSPNGSWAFSLLHTFGQGKDGKQPTGRLAFDAAANLYGETFTGGSANLGTVFELSQGAGGTWNETVLHSFIGGKDGQYPSAGVALYGGNVFGSTESGGITNCSSGCGVIFELSPNGNGSWKESFPRRFTKASDGYQPYGLTLDSAGNLYGSASGGNDACGGGCGLVYRMTEKSNGVWTFTALHYFDGADGYGSGAPVLGQSGTV